jgi:hypothetical protein
MYVERLKWDATIEVIDISLNAALIVPVATGHPSFREDLTHNGLVKRFLFIRGKKPRIAAAFGGSLVLHDYRTTRLDLRQPQSPPRASVL